MAVFIDKDIGGFDVSVDDFSCMKVVYGLSRLIDNVSFMFFFEYVLSDKGVKVDVHKLEHEVDVFLVLGFYYFL